jgi:integrase/recombinase XerC
MANGQLTEVYRLQTLAMTALDLGGAKAVSEHLDWLRSVGRSSETIEDRVRLLIRVSRWLGQLDPPKDLLSATPQDLYSWQLSIRNMAPESISTYVGHAKGFYAWLTRYHGAADAAELLVRPTIPRRLPRPIQDDDLQAALRLADGDMRIMLFLMAFCGARCGEVSRAQRSHIRDRANPPMALLIGKGGKERDVRMPNDTHIVLDEWRIPSRGHIVRGADGRRLSPNRVSQIVNGYLHSIGIADTAHSLRHWYGTNVYRITRDIRLVQEMMGHASPGTTAIYTQYDPLGADLMAAALDQRLAELFGRRNDPPPPDEPDGPPSLRVVR